jgi:hypothetical protein
VDHPRAGGDQRRAERDDHDPSHRSSSAQR